MQINAQEIEKIINGMEAKGRMSQTALAEKIGVHRSYISNLLRGHYDTIPDAQAVKISDALEIHLLPLQYEEGEVSSTALQLTEMAKGDASFSSVLEALVRLKGGDAKKAFIPSVSSEALQVIGAEVSRIVNQWEGPNGDYTPKIGAEVLSFLRGFYQRGEF